MAASPPLPQIVGNHGAVFEAYYKQADPNNTGSIGALDAAVFLKKSNLKENILSQVWDLSDPTGKGYLEKPGFFVALKLIALAQNGQDLSIAKLTTETPPPNLGPYELEPPPTAGTNVQWALSATEKSKYDQVFDNLQPVNGLLGGDKVKQILLNSKLATDVLGRIWDLSDIDKDGYLDRDEFALAMHLVHRGMEKEPIPPVLPPKLVPPSKRKAVPVGGVPVLPVAVSGRSTPVLVPESSTVIGAAPIWVVSPVEKASYDVMFRKADIDMDGFVSGQEIRSIFLQSGLQPNVLAHIWELCDTSSLGKLNAEQFALAIHLIQQKIKGVDPPAILTPEMVPPSMRPKQAPADTAAFGVTDGVTGGPFAHMADFSAMKELDMISKEIEEIKREKLQLEKDSAQRDADIKIINGEVQMLQKELDAITNTLQQLENQKKEAQKCLDELDDKKSNLEINVKEIREKCEEEQKQIDSLRMQLMNQEKSVQEQDEEFARLKTELNQLREEETQLEQKVDAGKRQLELLNKSHKDVQLQINQARTRVQHLQDQQRALQQGTGVLTSLGDDINSTTSVFSDDQFSTRATMGSPVSTISNFSAGSAMEDFKDDLFKTKDPFGSEGTPTDPFQSEDPFKGNDPFRSEGFGSDPFASDDPFKDAFGSSMETASSKADPFSSFDPFTSSTTSSTSSKKVTDAFAAFETSSSSSSTSSKSKVGGDLFGTDPFLPQSASFSSMRSESPTPVLPPKQRKAPPPRPAPPKGGKQSPSKPAAPKPSVDPFGGFPSDPFASADPFASTSTGNADSFANFADFSPSKFNSETDHGWGSSGSLSSTKTSGWDEFERQKARAKQEEEDYKFALALSRGEVPDSTA
ncbi:hypothetical protein ACJMK2_040915 [Sinanodonta woodiana]|uniref:Epidermal growth factor receptor substrate 15-like 1 n=1 Tax=Sinanodonta woodiana TaxID=1069815 RepID=A0ABD3W5U4_SINWO